jgi:hypothetical protein
MSVIRGGAKRQRGFPAGASLIRPPSVMSLATRGAEPLCGPAAATSAALAARPTADSVMPYALLVACLIFESHRISIEVDVAV